MVAPDPPTSASVAPFEEISPGEALRRQQAGALLIDVREPAEWASGMPAGALGVPRAELPARIPALAPCTQREILLICAGGARSRLAAETLAHLGYRRVASVVGGCRRWAEEGLPFAEGGLDADARERYARQLALPEVGAAGQAKLLRARVALVGAGGLGSPAALYLAAAGVGSLTLIDDDRVERSNLQRQVLHGESSVGARKVDSARQTLIRLNPRIEVMTRAVRLDASQVESLAGHDVIIDGADNLPTRYLLDAASRRFRVPLIYGAVHRFAGQLSVFDPRRESSPCYRCLFPQPPAASEAPNCAEAGVLGVLPGLIGVLQAAETLKLILGIGAPLVGRLLCIDALTMSFRELQLPRDPQCPGCGTATARVDSAELDRLGPRGDRLGYDASSSRS